MLRYERYKRRFWAVYEAETLICVCVYLKGALSVIERITGVRPERPTRKKYLRVPPVLLRPSQQPLFINDCDS